MPGQPAGAAVALPTDLGLKQQSRLAWVWSPVLAGRLSAGASLLPCGRPTVSPAVLTGPWARTPLPPFPVSPGHQSLRSRLCLPPFHGHLTTALPGLSLLPPTPSDLYPEILTFGIQCMVRVNYITLM